MSVRVLILVCVPGLFSSHSFKYNFIWSNFCEHIHVHAEIIVNRKTLSDASDSYTIISRSP